VSCNAAVARQLREALQVPPCICAAWRLAVAPQLRRWLQTQRPKLRVASLGVRNVQLQR
jgi:hypothetical protein